jgi:hypothetical protein
MQAMQGIGKGIALVFLLAGMCGWAGEPGPQQPGIGTQIPSHNSPLSPAAGDLPEAQKEKQAIARNEDRQKRLVADTDKLLQLATSLHDDVGKTDKNILSIDVIKRADEIEKLAHSIKDRMRG